MSMKTTETGHGRTDKRSCHVLEIPKDHPQRKLWKDLNTPAVTVSRRVIDGKETWESRSYASSHSPRAKQLAEAIRKHWGIENARHCVLDVTFGEDVRRQQDRNGGANLAAIRHAMATFSSREVMRFLGRTRMPAAGGVDSRFNGQVVSDLRARLEGVRIKHRMNRNSLKMYDKQGSVLRIETTINDARDLFVYRASEADPQGSKKLRRLRKGVVDLPRRSQISQGIR